MASPDCTILFLTANRVPDGWATFQKEKLLEAANGKPIITLSRKPLSWGINVLDTEPASISNIYFQMLRGAKLATTRYVAVAEDDCLYPPDHFDHQPEDNVFAYNENRFNIFTWGRSMYCFKKRVSNSTLVANRELVIKALEERFAKYPKGTPTAYTGELGRKNIEGKLGLPHYPMTFFETYYSVVRVDHQLGIDTLSQSRRKGAGMLKSFEIPHWGKAKSIIEKFK
jgi:hypothetical protein